MTERQYEACLIEKCVKKSDNFAPRDLATHLSRILREGIPDSPVDVSD